MSPELAQVLNQNFGVRVNGQGLWPHVSPSVVSGIGSSRSKTLRVAGAGDDINYIFPLDDLLYHGGQALKTRCPLAPLLVSELQLLQKVVPLVGV